MGSFSWLRADRLTKVSNIYYGCPFKCLIPKEFGGGFVKDHYQDYGDLGTKEDGSVKYDMYELLAFWNHDASNIEGRIIDRLKWTNKELGAPMPLMKEVDELTSNNRGLGIEIGCYDKQIRKLKYPLKLVSVKNIQTYEECEGISLGDPDQGWGKNSWDDYDKLMEKRKEEVEDRIKKELKIRVDLKMSLMRDTFKTIGANVSEDNPLFQTMIDKYSKEIEAELREMYT